MRKYILSVLFIMASSTIVQARDTVLPQNSSPEQEQSADQEEDIVICKSFWDGWFVECGLDMTLHNPYGHNFSKVIPKGTSFGLNAGVGKWFSPDIGLRGRINWENGFRLFENKKLEWVAPAGANGINMDKGGCMLVYLDVLLNMNSLLNGYDANRKWNVLIMPRMGIARNFALGSGSPFVGAGVGCTRKLNNRLSLYGDFVVHIVTSEYYGDVGPTGLGVNSGGNSFFILNVGVQWRLGK